MKSNKYIFTFGGGTADGDKSMKELLGGKGANLAEMSAIGLPIPPGFTITTEVCQYYNQNNGKWPKGVEEQLRKSVYFLEDLMGLTFGSATKPLLVSVRSGAAISMPGMMDTVLDLGLNDESVKGLSDMTNNPRFAFDCYRRFIDMFGDVVMGVAHELFEEVLQDLKDRRGIKEDTDLTVDDLQDLVERYKAVYRKETGYMFPQDPWEQLHFSVNAVFGSWSSKRAKTYRKINRITGLLGTAVNVQSMVYGNMGTDCATGVCFTRNPATGKKELFGEFLVNAQGEDVVAGIRTPRPIHELEALMPECYHELLKLTTDLEHHYKDVQDIEFTIQQGKLFILQTRSGKRTGTAAVKIAIDLVNEGLLSHKEAVKNLVEPRHLDQLLHPQLNDAEIKKEDIIGHGLPASPGAAGRDSSVYFRRSRGNACQRFACNSGKNRNES